MAAKPGSDLAGNELYDLIESYRTTVIIYVAARLGIADILAHGAKGAGELAQATGAHESSLRRLMRGLIAIGICTQTADGRFELTPTGRPMAASADRSMKAWALFEGGMLYRGWEAMLDSIRAGKTAAELAGVDNYFELMARNPEAVEVFNAAMLSLTNRILPAVLEAFDFSGITRLMDVGGGYGQLLCAILKQHQSLRGVVFDLPRCAEGAKKQIAEAGVGTRAEFSAGNFFESVPGGADAIVMKSIIHDWNDERSIKILRNCRQALPARGKLLLVERLMPERLEANADHRAVVTGDLNMLRGPGGCERTESEYRELLGKGGFRLTRVAEAGRVNVIESAPA
ncbi:MAG TPA: methyltransferase [Candidatus Binataceae bacterium]|nr:methyltransferase [Candidatus Binataceae bacterium]